MLTWHALYVSSFLTPWMTHEVMIYVCWDPLKSSHPIFTGWRNTDHRAWMSSYHTKIFSLQVRTDYIWAYRACLLCKYGFFLLSNITQSAYSTLDCVMNSQSEFDWVACRPHWNNYENNTNVNMSYKNILEHFFPYQNAAGIVLHL